MLAADDVEELRCCKDKTEKSDAIASRNEKTLQNPPIMSSFQKKENTGILDTD
jgi:hypothetical protein